MADTRTLIRNLVGNLNRRVRFVSEDEAQIRQPPVRPSNLDMGFASREVPDYNRNARIIYGVLSIAAVFFGALEIGAFAVFGQWATLVVGVVLLVFAGAVETSRRRVAFGQPLKAVRILCACFFPAIFVVTLVKPDLVAVLTLAPFLAVVMAIPLASSRDFSLILLGTWLSVVAVNVLAELLVLKDNVPVELPEYWGSGFRVAAVSTAAAFVLAAWKSYNLGFWHYRYESSYDALTHLPNKEWFHEQLREHRLRSASSSEHSFSVLFMDLDDFKLVNDALGQKVGDQLLYEVGRRLTLNLYGSDTVARVGANRYGIIIDSTCRSVDPSGVAIQLASQVEEIPFVVGDGTRHLGASFAVMRGPEDLPDLDQVESSVETALRTCKQESRTFVEVNDAQTRLELERTYDTGNLIARALEVEDQIMLHYQPVVHVRSGEILGVEVSAQWEHPTEGLVPLRNYFKYMEDKGYITQVTYRLLGQAMQQVAHWQDKYPANQAVRLYVRLTESQITSTGFVQQMGQLLSENALDGASVVIQISEEEFLKDSHAAFEVLSSLRRKYRMRICLEEFGAGGAGQSSLTTLTFLGPNLVKMHRSLMTGFNSEDRSREEWLAESTITIAHAGDMDVIAHEVTSEIQFQRLRDVDCNYAVGTLFAGPLSAEMMEIYLDEGINWP